MQRAALDHHLLQDAERFRAWFWLLLNAAWKPTRVRVKGQTVNLERGELSFSVRFLAEKWGWSKSKVDRFIADLRTESMIKTRSKSGTSAGHKAGQGQSIITICNYDKYQDRQDRPWDSDDAESGTSAGQRRTKEQLRSKKKPPKAPLAVDLKPADLDDETWDDWKRVRKRPVTKTVLTRIENEAAKIGWTLSDAIKEAAGNSWQGFNAGWVKDNGNGKPTDMASAANNARLRLAASRD